MEWTGFEPANIGLQPTVFPLDYHSIVAELGFEPRFFGLWDRWVNLITSTPHCAPYGIWTHASRFLPCVENITLRRKPRILVLSRRRGQVGMAGLEPATDGISLRDLKHPVRYRFRMWAKHLKPSDMRCYLHIWFKFLGLIRPTKVLLTTGRQGFYHFISNGLSLTPSTQGIAPSFILLWSQLFFLLDYTPIRWGRDLNSQNRSLQLRALTRFGYLIFRHGRICTYATLVYKTSSLLLRNVPVWTRTDLHREYLCIRQAVYY